MAKLSFSFTWSIMKLKVVLIKSSFFPAMLPDTSITHTSSTAARFFWGSNKGASMCNMATMSCSKSLVFVEYSVKVSVVNVVGCSWPTCPPIFKFQKNNPAAKNRNLGTRTKDLKLNVLDLERTLIQNLA
eukprot:Lithocolla_globosa_v1_NODE_5719_length_1197_cov_3.418564.p2 type:complete len:130 gc:universal NODE_5719_length_1197_cov_3.418564:484-95(-)